MGANQREWADYVGRAEFNCNVVTNLVSKGSSLVVAYEVEVLEPTNLTFKWANSTLEFNEDEEDLAKKRE